MREFVGVNGSCGAVGTFQGGRLGRLGPRNYPVCASAVADGVQQCVSRLHAVCMGGRVREFVGVNGSRWAQLGCSRGGSDYVAADLGIIRRVPQS